MIPENFIEQWRGRAPWAALAMVEQDLIISKALADLYTQEVIQNSLVFRGGTALNKLYIQPPARYSEDIDLVQLTAEPIGKTINIIRSVLDNWLGEPKRKLTDRSAKLIYRYQTVDGIIAKLKIEINTTEHVQFRPLKKMIYAIKSEWFTGQADITTYELDELMATKLRALYQRQKGRDLFDLWYVLTQNLINVDNVIDIFQKYCNHDGTNISGNQFIQNLEFKSKSKDFQRDMNALLPPEFDWNFEEAFDFVSNKIINKLP